jgi:filamentous hemagglutinin family protein
MQRKWRRRWQRLQKTILPPVAAGLLFLSVYSPAYANPNGGEVTSGSATIATSGSTTTIDQTTDKTIINWQSFSIAGGETVNFIQPSGTAVALNRVVGSDSSNIYGSLTANGKVYLVNPNGILFAPGSSVNVGGLAASTLNLADSDFLDGKYTFQNDGGAGSVVNRGNITAANEAALIGPLVANEGVISANVVGLGAGNQVSLDFSGDRLLNLIVDTGAYGGGAANSGTLTTTGGLVVMSAGTADALLATVVNNSGVIRARTVTRSGGVIRLEGATATNSGTLDAAGTSGGATGGTVKVLGDIVTLTSSANIDVSGDVGGGVAQIGGAYQGGSGEYAATATTVAQGATVNADAITGGNGGAVVVWAGDTLNFAGTISAKGGNVSGEGGSVETSGRKTLNIADTASVDTTAVSGATGNWLLDPVDITIGSGGDISVATLQTALATANVNISTGGDNATLNGSPISTDPSGNGDITISSAIAWSTANTLTLAAYRNVNINAAVTSTGGGGLTIATNTGGAGGTLITGADGSVAFGGTTPGALTINGQGYTLINTFSELRTMGETGCYALNADIDAAGFSGDNVLLDNFYGTFEGLGHTIGNLNLTASAITDITIHGTGLFGNVYGSVRNLGVVGAVTGTCAFNDCQTALLAYCNRDSGTISNCYSGGTVNVTHSADNSSVGGLVGYNDGTISNCYNTAAVTGAFTSTNTQGLVGGLAGYNHNTGKIEYSYNMGGVTLNSATGLENYYAGGLVGYNYKGAISNCYNTGSVTGANTASNAAWCYIGGLTGENFGTIESSYNSGGVSGTAASMVWVGGLAGSNVNNIRYCYNTGSVRGTGNYSHLGGLAGQNVVNTNDIAVGRITDCYNTGSLNAYSGTFAYVGGVTGHNFGATIKNCYNAGSVTIGDSYSTVQLGGLVGLNQSILSSAYTGSVSYCYWDTEAFGASASIGKNQEQTVYSNCAGMTTAGLMAALPGGFGGSDWSIISGTSYPYLKWRYSVTPQVVSGTASGAAGETVVLVKDGAVLGSTATGANDFYYFLLDNGAITTSNAVLTYMDGGGITAGSAVSRASGANASITGLNIHSNAVTVYGGASPAELDVSGVMATALGGLNNSNILYSVSGANASVNGNLSVTADGTLTQSGALAVSGTTGLTAGGDITLTNGGNALSGTITISGGGDVTLYNSLNTQLGAATTVGSLAVAATGPADTLNVGGAVNAGGDIRLTAPGNLEIAVTGSVTSNGGDVALVSTADHFCNSGSVSVSTPNGRWLIYSVGPTGDQYNGLDADYNFTQYGSGYGGAVESTGNGFIYSEALTITASLTGAVSKIYDGTTAALLTAGNVTFSSGLTNATYGFTSSANYGDKNVGAVKAVTADLTVTGMTDGGGKAVYGYNSSIAVGGNVGTITAAPLTITAGNATKTYGETVTLSGYTVSGLANGDIVSGVTLASAGEGATAQTGTYSIAASAAVGNGLGNYDIHYIDGTLTVVRPPWQYDTYTGAVIHADYAAAGILGPVGRYGQPFVWYDPASGYMAGVSGGATPFIIAGPGINTGGNAPQEISMY